MTPRPLSLWLDWWLTFARVAAVGAVLVGCTNKYVAAERAKEWVKALGLEPGGATCAKGRCSVVGKRPDGATVVFHLACDEDECIAAERAEQTQTVIVPVPQ